MRTIDEFFNAIKPVEFQEQHTFLTDGKLINGMQVFVGTKNGTVVVRNNANGAYVLAKSE